MRALRSCPVCGMDSENASLFVDENIDKKKLSGFSFSSRKEPEYMCHRMVRCNGCDLVYVDQPPDEAELASAYHSADYDSSAEASDAALSYIHALRPILDKLPRRESALEIGTGTGVFLERLSKEGFVDLVGIEPSASAIESAPEHRLPWIREGMFNENDFPKNSFDLICCFMTMEHVRDPHVVAQAAFRLLRPGGVFVTVTHDYRSIVNRILGIRSPIIDIEHLQIFSEKSVHHLFEKSDYTDITVKAFKNTYSLNYWLRLAPLPSSVKSLLIRLMTFIGLGGIKVGINVGNQVASGTKLA